MTRTLNWSHRPHSLEVSEIVKMDSNNHKMMIDEKASIKWGMFTGEVDLVGQVTLYTTVSGYNTQHNTRPDGFTCSTASLTRGKFA